MELIKRGLYGLYAVWLFVVMAILKAILFLLGVIAILDVVLQEAICGRFDRISYTISEGFGSLVSVFVGTSKEEDTPE